MAKDPPPAPPLAQPPKAQAIASNAAVIAARRGVGVARQSVVMVSLIAPERYR
jgi:hypothetical protein